MLRGSWEDRLYYASFLGLLALTVAPFWSSRLLPLMDYSNFLVFCRAVQDMGDPGSPFHGTYTTGGSVAPLLLPISLTRAFSVFDGQLETGGRVLLTIHAIGIPLGSAALLRATGQSRWNVLLVFPLVFSRMVTWGFFGFITGLPWMLLLLALAVQQFRQPRLWRLGALTALFAGLALWHGLIVLVAGLFFGVLWLCWRAPDPINRFLGLLPTAGALVFLLFWALGFDNAAAGAQKPFDWLSVESAFNSENFLNRVFMLGPGLDRYAKGLGLLLLVLAGLFGSRAGPPAATSDWFASRPLRVLALVSLAAYFLIPYKVLGVEVVNYRFIWLAALFLVLGMNPPRPGWPRRLSLTLLAAFSVNFLLDVNGRFRDFHRQTVGASELIDRVGPGQTLLAPLSKQGTPAFPRSAPIREVQQYASIRAGGLPSNSFALFPGNYVRFVAGKNPMPVLNARSWGTHPQLRRFDYVLLRRRPRTRAVQRRIRLLASAHGWHLYSVCGSRAFPRCAPTARRP